MPTSSIDDLLMGGSSNQHPMPTEEKSQYEPEPIEEIESEVSADDDQDEDVPQDDHTNEQGPPDDEDEKPQPDHKKEFDDYGNEKEPENEAIRERLARQARKHQAEIDALRAQLAQQGATQPMQQAVKDFEYDPESSGDWQQQLASFVKQTVNSMTRDQQDLQARNEELRNQQEFESKFREGMGRFNDFVDVMDDLSFEISNPMTLATRAMSDPAAFLYAAAKRNPQELERISKLRDPYAQMTEMGKLEERMRKNKPSTKAPRPLERTQENAAIPSYKKKTDPTIEELIAKADAKKLAGMKGRPGKRN